MGKSFLDVRFMRNAAPRWKFQRLRMLH